ncbi:TetR/AcrR family transcriptional regulator [Agromyces binzhouensis]|uniref:TetR/AcrR family transcriptional regulator n=1 Tax=Agromyces binzhouensis TaxID=1817495 RepID=UPI0013ED8710|nr:TetR family transcriptional regulator [Agromyces binzhouensis]
MVRDAAQTRRRILAAALTEFAEGGFAGARIAGISEAAGANQRMIYAYFGSKEGLYDAVVDEVIERVHAEVPFEPDDLPAYAVALFDYAVGNPEVVRFQARRTLEAREATARELELYGEKLDAIRRVQQAGGLPAGESPAELLVGVTGAVAAWLQAPTGLRPSLRGVDMRERVRHDVEALVAPAPADVARD